MSIQDDWSYFVAAERQWSSIGEAPAQDRVTPQQQINDATTKQTHPTETKVQTSNHYFSVLHALKTLHVLEYQTPNVVQGPRKFASILQSFLNVGKIRSIGKSYRPG